MKEKGMTNTSSSGTSNIASSLTLLWHLAFLIFYQTEQICCNFLEMMQVYVIYIFLVHYVSLHVLFSDFTKEAAMTTYRAYNTTILDHGFASFHEKIQEKTGTEMLYSNEKQS